MRKLIAMLAAAVMLSACGTTAEQDSAPRVPDWARQDPAKATVITSERRPADCISPISVYRIDDRNITGGMMQFELDPGVHAISGRALISDDFCSHSMIASSGSRAESLKPLEQEFEAGKVYFIGVDHTASRASGWEIVVWSVQDK